MSASAFFMYHAQDGNDYANVVFIDGAGNIRQSYNATPGPTADYTGHVVLAGPDAARQVPTATKPAVAELGLDLEQHAGYVNVTARAEDGSLIHVSFVPGVGWKDYSLGGTAPPAPPVPAATLNVEALATAAEAHVIGIAKGTTATRRFIGADLAAWLRRNLAPPV